MQNYLRAQAKLETAWKQVSYQFLFWNHFPHMAFMANNKQYFDFVCCNQRILSMATSSKYTYQDLESRLGTTLITEATMLQRWFHLKHVWQNYYLCLFLSLHATFYFREGIHNHCRSCIVSSCALGKWNSIEKNVLQILFSGKLFDPALWRESCPIGDCPWACGARVHMCKVFNNFLFFDPVVKELDLCNQFQFLYPLTPIATT